jgi:hypothetical protein
MNFVISFVLLRMCRIIFLVVATMASYLRELPDEAFLEHVIPQFEEYVPIVGADRGRPSTSSEFKETTGNELKYLLDLNNKPTQYFLPKTAMGKKIH